MEQECEGLKALLHKKATMSTIFHGDFTVCILVRDREANMLANHHRPGGDWKES